MTTTASGVITTLIASIAFFFAHNFIIKVCAKIRRKQSNPTTGAIIYWVLRIVIIVALQWIITGIIDGVTDSYATGYAVPMNAYYWFCLARDIATSIYGKKVSSQVRKKVSYGIYVAMIVYHFLVNASGYGYYAPVCAVVSFIALIYASITFAKAMKKLSKYASGSSSAPTTTTTAPRTTYTPTVRPTTTTTTTTSTPKKTIQEGSYYSTEQGRRYAQENSSIILKLFESLEENEVIESIKGSNGDVEM